jgi:predicted dehydrogenase
MPVVARAMKAKELGIAVVGSGRIGTLRARLAAKHPAVRFLAVSDKKVEQAKTLADLTGADFYSTDNNEVIARPEVTAVFVSTPEGEHAAPVCKALELGKPVLVEKPLALSLNDAEAILKTVKQTSRLLRIGYSRRFKECFLRAKEQMVHGRLGKNQWWAGARL